MNTKRSNVTGYDIASWLIMGAALLFVLNLRLLPALLAGLLVHELVHLLSPHLRLTRLSGDRARMVVVTLLTVAVIVTLGFSIWALIAFFRSDSGSIPALFQRMAEIIEGSREKLPAWLIESLPNDAEGVKNWSVGWLHRHAGEVQVAGKEAGRMAAHILVGMVIGALISLREVTTAKDGRPLARALEDRAARLSHAFRAIVFAQVRISALNTLFSLLYLAVALPALGIHLPLIKTMVIITFIAGLMPIIGNLISNTVIVVVSLSHSLDVTVASLVFLAVIHKLEYFLNARIVGAKISARAWELLLAMLVMEAAFGISGLIAAPIYYAYVKDELADRGLV